MTKTPTECLPPQTEPRDEPPFLSIIVVCFDMAREAPRTVYSLSTAYQQGVSSEQYEIIVVDNNSKTPLNKDEIEGLGNNIRYLYHETDSRSPVGAINKAVEIAQGNVLGILIDGARLLTPGVIRWVLLSLKLYESPIISTLGWHLGPDVQYISVPNGYTQAIEDQLLDEIDWMNCGYNLFLKSSLAGSSRLGFFLPISESNAIFLPRKLYQKIGGYDEAFDLPGGGYCNLDFYNRACEAADTAHVILLGEGTFHQHHGGVTTSSRRAKDIALLAQFSEQYQAIRHKAFTVQQTNPVYLGQIPTQCLQTLQHSVEQALLATQ